MNPTVWFLKTEFYTVHPECQEGIIVFLISYDLIKQKDYERLFAALKQLGAVRVLLSAWAVKCNTNSVTLRNYLRAFIDNDDRLVVMQFSDWAALNALIDLNRL